MAKSKTDEHKAKISESMKKNTNASKKGKEKIDDNMPPIPGEVLVKNPGQFLYLRELPVVGLPPAFNVPQIDTALISVEQGNFFGMSLLIDSMGRDDRFLATLNTRLLGLFGSELQIKPADDSPLAQEIADELKEKFHTIFPQDQLMAFMSWDILLGFAVAELEWEMTEDEWLPKFRNWHPQRSRWNIMDETYRIITENESEIIISPGDGQWVLGTRYSYRWGWLRGVARSIAKSVLSRQWAIRDISAYNEVRAFPILAGEVPASAEVSDQKKFLSTLANVGSNTTLRLPILNDGTKFDVRYVEAAANNYQSFQFVIAEMNKSISIALLGQAMSTEGVAGLGSQSDSGEEVRGDIKDFDNKTLSSQLREQVLKKWCLFNYGDEKLAPILEWMTEPPEDMGQRSAEISAIANSLTLLDGYGVDIEALLENHKIPLLKDKKEIK